MNQFKRLIEHANKHGVVHGVRDIRPLDTWWVNMLKQCQPFVFSPAEPIPYYTEENDTHDRALALEEKLDAPFRVFSIEYPGGLPLALTEGKFRAKIRCLVAVEVIPKRFVFLKLQTVNDRIMVFAVGADASRVAINFLSRIKKQDLGTEQVKVAIKVGGKKMKQIHRISTVIHVAPKKGASYSTGTKEVDWSHRFAVRGHWVTLTPGKIGKDRAGDYCVNGFTWRSDYVKGPDHLPFIPKTRLVEKLPEADR